MDCVHTGARENGECVINVSRSREQLVCTGGYMHSEAVSGSESGQHHNKIHNFTITSYVAIYIRRKYMHI